jgi:hypothetical protein
MYEQFGKQMAKQKRMPVQGKMQVELPGGGCAKQWACLKVNRCVWKEFVGSVVAIARRGFGSSGLCMRWSRRSIS